VVVVTCPLPEAEVEHEAKGLPIAPAGMLIAKVSVDPERVPDT
jgi:hypothetical protein